MLPILSIIPGVGVDNFPGMAIMRLIGLTAMAQKDDNKAMFYYLGVRCC